MIHRKIFCKSGPRISVLTSVWRVNYFGRSRSRGQHFGLHLEAFVLVESIHLVLARPDLIHPQSRPPITRFSPSPIAGANRTQNLGVGSQTATSRNGLHLSALSRYDRRIFRFCNLLTYLLAIKQFLKQKNELLKRNSRIKSRWIV